jgi:hypothetical protein
MEMRPSKQTSPRPSLRPSLSQLRMYTRPLTTLLPTPPPLRFTATLLYSPPPG